MPSLISASVVLLVFYLYVLVRPQGIHRTGCYLLGMAALLASLLLVGIFSAFRDTVAVAGVFQAILNTVAFGMAVAACYRGELPMADKLERRTARTAEAPPPPEAAEAPEGGRQQPPAE
jgi:hypothetical protein